MRQVKSEDVLAELNFMAAARQKFMSDPEIQTYGDMEPGSLFAIRWGLVDDCIVVFKIDEDYGIRNYVQEIPRR